MFGQKRNLSNLSSFGLPAKAIAVIAVLAISWVFIAPSVDLVDSTCDRARVDMSLPVTPIAIVLSGLVSSRSEAGLLRHADLAESRREILDLTCTRVC